LGGVLVDSDPLEPLPVVDDGVGSLVVDDVVLEEEVDDVVAGEELDDVVVGDDAEVCGLKEEVGPTGADTALPVVGFAKGNIAWTA
jgi:hypothetical protein